jgi:hypothetical protein
MNSTPVTRHVFVQNLVASGLTYDQAVRAYNSIMSTIADGVVTGRKVYIGQTGVLNPVVLPPRTVTMNIPATGPGGKVIRHQKEYFLDSRIKYSFRLFKKFAETHELKWA